MKRTSAAIFALLVAGGCSGRDAARDAGEAARSLVRVDLAFTRTAASGDPRFDAEAHFVRYSAFDPAGVPTLLGIADFDSVPVDTCRASDGTAALDEALSADATVRGGASPEVNLLDAGRLEVRGPSERATLAPRHYPELVPFVSGVVYGADDLAPVSLAFGQTYQVTGEGGEEVGPFAAAASAPRAFPSLQSDPLHRGGDLELRWSGEGASLEPLLLELKWSTRAGARAVRCRVRDDGAFTVSRDLLDASRIGGSATVTATRLTRALLQAPGAGAGELTVALREVSPLLVQP